MTVYTQDFFRSRETGSLTSAHHIVPIVLDLVRPKSVVDVGCGLGTWLAVFAKHGVEDILGIDGGYVPTEALHIPPSRFRSCALTEALLIDRAFDLVVSLEVAEHLPRESAETFVESLATLGPAVLFSAAIPFQGGTGHVNEQWPEYWVKLFEARGFAAIDCVRPKVWNNEEVDWWYAQNTLLFVARDRMADDAGLQSALEQTEASRLSMVHPRKWLAVNSMIAVRNELSATMSDLERVIPEETTFILVDHDMCGIHVLGSRRALPFLEQDGKFWGLPADGATAIRELERLRDEGARFIAFASMAFWWLEHYPDLAEYLRTRCRCVLENGRLVVFCLNTPSSVG